MLPTVSRPIQLLQAALLRRSHPAAFVRRRRGLQAAAPSTPRPTLQPRRGLLTLSAASSRPPSSSSLAHLPPDMRAEVIRALELAERASSSWTLTHTDFLTPPAAATALAALAGRADVAGLAWGGWPGAERKRLVLGQPYRLAEEVAASANLVVLPDDDEEGAGGTSRPSSSLTPALADQAIGGVAAVSLRGRFTFEAATHRDFLGATLNGAGLDRRVVGDILLDGEAGATLFVAPGVVPAIEAGVTSVRGVRVVATRLDPADVRPPAPPSPPTPVHSTEASLRLDAVASAGFRTSRARMADAIRSGAVRLNWTPTTKGSTLVGQGDIISCAGKGRVEVVEVGVTAKGRWRIEMLRFV